MEDFYLITYGSPAWSLKLIHVLASNILDHLHVRMHYKSDPTRSVFLFCSSKIGFLFENEKNDIWQQNDSIL